MQKKKKLFILLTVLSTVIVAILIILINYKSRELENYDKYLTSIQISSLRENFQPIVIDVRDDGENAFVTKNDLQNQIYIINNDIYYLKKNTIYRYPSKRNYRSIYSIIKKYSPVKNDNFEITLKTNQINDLLDALHFSKKTSSDEIARVTIKNNKIKRFELTIYDIEDYETLNINISFSELSENYKVDKDVLNGNVSNPSLRRRIEKTNQNILEIIN